MSANVDTGILPKAKCRIIYNHRQECCINILIPWFNFYINSCKIWLSIHSMLQKILGTHASWSDDKEEEIQKKWSNCAPSVMIRHRCILWSLFYLWIKCIWSRNQQLLHCNHVLYIKYYQLSRLRNVLVSTNTGPEEPPEFRFHLKPRKRRACTIINSSDQIIEKHSKRSVGLESTIS